MNIFGYTVVDMMLVTGSRAVSIGWVFLTMEVYAERRICLPKVIAIRSKPGMEFRMSGSFVDHG
jgi:hypothetical protein